MTFAYRVVAGISRPAVRAVFGLRVTGAELLPPAGFVLASNHLSALDPWALACPLYPRQPRFMAKAELFRPGLDAVLSALGVFPVRRGAGDVAAIETGVAHAKSGGIVVVFPHGSRRRKAPDARAQSGAARIALTSGVPLVPAAVRGTDRTRPNWCVAFGAPVPLDDLAGLPGIAAARAATERLSREIGRLERTLA